jgi:galactose mutarotase-like enzyme
MLSHPSSKCSLYLPIIYLCNNTYRLENNGHYVLHGRAVAPEKKIWIQKTSKSQLWNMT